MPTIAQPFSRCSVRTLRRSRVNAAMHVDGFISFNSSGVRCETFGVHGGFAETLPMGIEWRPWLRIHIGYCFHWVDTLSLIYRAVCPGQMSKHRDPRQRRADRIRCRFGERHSGALHRGEIRRAGGHARIIRGFAAPIGDLGRSTRLFLKETAGTTWDLCPRKGLRDIARLNSRDSLR